MSRVDLYPTTKSSPSTAQIQTGTAFAGDKVAADVNVIGGSISGTFEPTGLSKNVKTSVVTVTDVPALVTPSPLTDRNALSIRVWGDQTVYFGEDLTVTSTSGYPKTTLEELALDIKENPAMEIWAVCESGRTSELRVLELA
jgi:hypothetical protein